jgi:predicted flavoprotein YhiN
MKYLKIENIKIQELNKKQIVIIINTLKHFAIKIDRVEEKERSYVNGGGVTTDEINPKTMESKLIKGLYFAGEVTDIHGPIGGFNITIAMSMGCTAIKSI